MPALGFLNLWKPRGISSARAIAVARRRLSDALGEKIKIGHGGTLDPLAEGILPVAIGRATRLLPFCPLLPKVYRAKIVLGARSRTDDAEGPIEISANFAPPSRQKILENLEVFRGKFDQKPALFSAKKIDGQKAYDLARRGEIRELRAVPVEVFSLEILDFDPAVPGAKIPGIGADFLAKTFPVLDLRVAVGSGFFVRSLARDLGDRLGGGGFLAGLVREKVGVFEEKNSTEPDEISPEEILDPREILSLPRVRIDAADAAKIQNGQKLSLEKTSARLVSNRRAGSAGEISPDAEERSGDLPDRREDVNQSQQAPIHKKSPSHEFARTGDNEILSDFADFFKIFSKSPDAEKIFLENPAGELVAAAEVSEREIAPKIVF